MSDLISRQGAIDAIHEDIDWLVAQGGRELDLTECMERAKSILNNLPSAEPKKGKWINMYISATGDSDAECDQCGAIVHNNFSTTINFCPNCGADMREGDAK